MNPLPLVAVVGSPNAGKSALFNALTGARQRTSAGTDGLTSTLMLRFVGDYCLVGHFLDVIIHLGCPRDN